MKRYVMVVVAVLVLAALACGSSGQSGGVRPTNTAGPTITPGPSPTPTPRPLAPTCGEILNAKAGMTDAQWDKFKDEVSGTWVIEWEGHVREVGDRSILAGGYPVYVAISRECDLYYVVKTEDEALSFAKDQPAIITAQVDYIAIILGDVVLYLEEYTVEIE